MTSYSKIWFPRHGQTEPNKLYRLLGQIDQRLSAQNFVETHQREVSLLPDLQEPRGVSALGQLKQIVGTEMPGLLTASAGRIGTRGGCVLALESEHRFALVPTA